MDNYKPISEGQVTFGDRVKSRVLGKGILNMEAFPRLKGVLHVDGLKANLISRSQICNLDLHVNFTHEKCSIMDNCENCVLEGFRSVNNCYTLS